MKKITLLSILLSFLTNVLIAQSDESVFHLGFSVTPKATMQVLENKDWGDSYTQFSVSLNGDIYYDPSSWVQIKSGIGLSRFMLSHLDYTPLFGCDYDGVGGALIYNSYYKPKVNSLYVNVPLSFKIKILDNKNAVFVDLGVQNYFRINSGGKVELYECGIHISDLMDFTLYNNPQKYLFTLNGGIGFEVTVSRTQRFIVEPTVEFALTKTYEKTDTNTNLINNSKILNLGLLIGYRF